jgi:hypothetical protein
MLELTIHQHMQPDGSIWHIADGDCPLEPCYKLEKQGEFLDNICDYLHFGRIDDRDAWYCSKAA